jgi:hypothetical protein
MTFRARAAGRGRAIRIVALSIVAFTTGCRAPQFQSATIPAPADPGAAELAASRPGAREAVLLTYAHLHFQRDDPAFVRVVVGIPVERVRLVRKISADASEVELTACEERGDLEKPQFGAWVRYRWRTGAPRQQVTRGTGAPPWSHEPAETRRLHANLSMFELTTPRARIAG